jgi:hypothetical protein
MSKNLLNFPQFIVAEVHDDGPVTDTHAHYTLTGAFTSLRGVKLGRASLIMQNLDGLAGNLEQLNEENRRGVFTAMEESLPCKVGDSLAFVDGYWKPDLIKVIVQPERKVQKIIFSAADAVACRYEINGSEDPPHKGGSVWRKISPEEIKARRPILAEAWSGQRFVGEPWIVPGGWDHEHCEICMKNINGGDMAFVELEDELWFCKECGEKYVLPHDLSFIGEGW